MNKLLQFQKKDIVYDDSEHSDGYPAKTKLIKVYLA